MLKTDSLREAADPFMPMVSGQPGKIHHFFVENGNIENDRRNPSFVYRYQMVMLSWIRRGAG